MSTRQTALGVLFVILLVFVVAILLPAPSNTSNPSAQSRPAATRRPTAAPTATPTLQGRILAAIGEINRDGAPTPDILFADQAVIIKYPSNDGLSVGSIRRSTQRQIVAIARVVRAFTQDELFITVTGPLTDAYGNTSEADIIRLRITRPTLEKINFDNFDIDNLPVIADYYWQHPALAP